jgi:metal-sulfur cluster biosynthetic enzyme
MSSEREVPNAACSHTEYREGTDPEDLPATGEGAEGLAADVWETLYDVEDPEMPISIVDLGLIYGVDVEGSEVRIDMTLTYTGCPARDMLLDTVRERVAAVEGVDEVDLRLVWNPDWNVEMVTQAGRERLREFGLSI